METFSRQDALRSSASHASRSSSVSSGMTSHSTSTHTHAPEVNPPPAYIAPGTASEVAGRYQPSSIIDEDGDERPITPLPQDPKVSQGALVLLNTFLDELLYNCLAVSRSSTLAVLRRAVENVLKGRLARYATANADEEINDLLPDGDDPEEADFREKEREASFKWDLETVWRRARLKIMVYTHMGELEEEDEEFFLEEEREQMNSQEEWRSSHASRQVSWSAVVFMTSVLEYVAEQCIIVAGQAAFDRVHKRRIARDGRVTPSTVHGDDEDDERIRIIEQDVEKLALNPTLGRMWRHWRRGLKSSKIGRPQTTPRMEIIH